MRVSESTTSSAPMDRGQTTAEYALVLVGAATIAMLIVAWAGSTSRIGALLDAVLRSVTSMVT